MRTQDPGAHWVDPDRGRTAFRSYRERWLATKVAKAEATYVWYKAIAEARVADRWDETPISAITAAAYQEWLAEVRGEVSASRTRAHHVVVKGILDLAIDDRALTVNVADRAKEKLPPLPRRQPKALTPVQLAAYVAALENPVPSDKKHARRTKSAESCERAACFGLALAFSGLRFGECIRLDVEHLVGRRLIVQESIATVGGRQVDADTKTHREREVSIPQPIADRIREMVGDRTTGPLLPAARGGRWHHGVWTKTHQKACTDAGLGHVKPHQLRNTAASIAISSGADAKVVQRMLGHASGAMTLDTYASMFEDRLDEVSDAMASAVPPRAAKTGPHLRVV
jgi:integrase